MLTPNEARERLARMSCHESDFAGQQVLDFLRDVMPELVALASGRSLDDAGRRYRDEVRD